MGGKRPHQGQGAFPARPLPASSLTRRLDQAEAEDWDFGGGKIFGSMCTKPLRQAITASNRFVTANLGNPGLCPGTARLEEELMEMVLDLYHGPPAGGGGHLVTGATEANITALWVARNLTGGTEVILPQSAHFSLVKALDILGLKGRWVRTGRDGRVDVHGVERALSRRTAAIVGVAGTTELGAVDNLPELSRLALDSGVRLHVDAAFGGFVIPFLADAVREDLRFDFELDGVTSLATDPHKMGLAPVPSGILLMRRIEEMNAISVASPYLSDPIATALLGTRPSRNVAATYAAISALGRGGYIQVVKRVMQMTSEIVRLGRALGLDPVIDPVLNVVALRHDNPSYVQDAMLLKGWDLSSVKSPSALRFVVMPHSTMSTVRAMMKDLGDVLRSPLSGSP